jgi:tetratricopeptide (TPR) repeat protein
MERKIYLILFALLMLFHFNLYGNEKLKIYYAYVHNDMKTWKHVIDSMQKEKSKSNAMLLTLVNYQYGYIGWCLGVNNDKEAEHYISLVESNLDLLEKNNYSLSMVYAYQSALYGYKIGLSPVRAPYYGPRSIQSVKESLQLDDDNYFAMVQAGNIHYYMPRIFGGSVNEAISYFLKAKTMMEKNSTEIHQNWNYLHLLTLIAQAYSKAGDNETAKRYYDLILKKEPQFKWIKDKLYDDLLKKMFW